MRKPKPVVRGTSVAAHKPSVLVLVPVVPTAILLAVIVPLAIAALRSAEADRAKWFSIVTLTTALGGVFIGWARSRKTADYRRVLDAVGELELAWSGLEKATGIAHAVEANLAAAKNLARVAGAKHTGIRRRIARLEIRLRVVSPQRRPATVEEVGSFLYERYHDVYEINQELVAIISRLDKNMDLVDVSSQGRLNVAIGEWETALTKARGACAPWCALEKQVERSATLVKYWLRFAQNDVYYRQGDARFKDERNLAFKQAAKTVREFYNSVLIRDLGSPWWRVALITAINGRRHSDTIDECHNMIH